MEQNQNKPECKLTGEDGNVFSIIGAVKNVLKNAGREEEAIEFVMKAVKSKSYDEVLILCTKYVEVV